MCYGCTTSFIESAGTFIHRHILLIYGKPGTKQPSSVPQTKSRSQRIEQLKQMYRKGMGVEGDELMEPESDKGRESGDLTEAPDEVEKLLEWTNTLDEQMINQASPL